VVTEKQVAANQQNAQKSTGPRTEQGKRVSSQNNFKHGYYAQIKPEAMAALHEDPLEKIRIHADLTNSYPPQNPSQQMVIDDLTEWRWHRLQVVRSRAATLGLKVRDVDRHRDLMHLQINHDVADVPQAEVLEKGLRNIADCPAKFEVLIAKFEALIEQAEALDYSQALPHLIAVYGKQASPRGATIFNLFMDLDRLEHEREAERKAGRPWPPPGDLIWKDKEYSPKKGDEPGSDRRLDRPCEALLMDLNMELHEVQTRYRYFIEDKVVVTAINRDAAIAPNRDSLTAVRELAIVDREIAAKIRLFMEMRVKDQQWRLVQQQDQESEEQVESETAKSAGKVGPSGARPGADSGPAETTARAGQEAGSDGGQPKADPEPDGTPRRGWGRGRAERRSAWDGRRSAPRGPGAECGVRHGRHGW